MQVAAETTVALPPDTTFRLFAELERSDEYAGPVIERRKITDGPVGGGDSVSRRGPVAWS